MGPADVEGGRDAYGRRAWSEAYAALREAGQAGPLAAEDVERLAVCAYMLGRDEEYLSGLEQAHQAHLEAGDTSAAVRCAFWVGLNLMTHGEVGPARGWFARAERMLEAEGMDCVERGYLAIPAVIEHVVDGDTEAAHAAASSAAAIAARFDDRDLLALAVHEQGHALIRMGRVEEGLRLLDETMVSVTAGELSPVATGIVYCNTIAFCQSVFELRRAREWTEHLTRWCDEQPDMVAHTGVCLVHRAEIMELQGAWPDALRETRRAAERFARVAEQRSRGRALYLEGELHRLQGDLDTAEAAYRTASRCGYEPQPGLALLRLEQGNPGAAAGSIRRALGETSRRLARVPLLPAAVEILVAAGELDEAAGACRELHEIAETQQSEAIRAMAARARGEVMLAQGDARGALVLLRDAARAWQALDAPYEAARARRWSFCATPPARGRRSTRRTRRRGRGCSSDRPAARWATRTRLPSSSTPPVTRSSGSERYATPPASMGCLRPELRSTTTGCPHGSSRCSGASRPARRTRRSRPSSSSASGPSTGT